MGAAKYGWMHRWDPSLTDSSSCHINNPPICSVPTSCYRYCEMRGSLLMMKRWRNFVALGLIARTISYKRSDVLLKLYKSLVRPHLEYCVSAWSPYYQKDKHLLERIQHRFTRMMKQLPYEERLGQLGLWSLEERRNRGDLLQVFKMFKGL